MTLHVSSILKKRGQDAYDGDVQPRSCHAECLMNQTDHISTFFQIPT